MDQSSIEKYRGQLCNGWPLVGGWMRNRAARMLAASGDAGAARALAECAEHARPEVAEAAIASLGAVSAPSAIDAVCSQWVKGRAPALRSLIREKKWQARSPLDARVLSGLVSGKLSADAASVPILASAMEDPDEGIRAAAAEALRNSKGGVADRLCTYWAESRDRRVTELVKGKKHVPKDPVSARVLTSLLTGTAVGDAAAIPDIVTALSDRDSDIRAAADKALRALQDPAAIDALCALWVEKRDEGVSVILRQRQYVARSPIRLEVLSRLLSGPCRVDHETAALIVEGLGDKLLRPMAVRSVENLDGAGADALCAVAVHDPAGEAARLCVAKGYLPSDHEDACLFLVVTHQLDKYFAGHGFDDRCQGLRAASERTTPELREMVLRVARSGAVGFDPFWDAQPIHRSRDEVIRAALDSALKRRDWPWLFRAFLDLPMKHAFPLLEEFRKSGWEPEADEMKILYRAVLAESASGAVPPTAAATSPVFERWLAEGPREFAGLDEPRLLEKLRAATPPEGVRLVAALAQTQAGEAARTTVRESGHWLVRLAGYATGLCRAGLEPLQDSVYWVNELVNPSALLDLRPRDATPADLDALQRMPREAFLGESGAVRRVLQLVLAHRVTAADISEPDFEIDEFAGEFEVAG